MKEEGRNATVGRSVGRVNVRPRFGGERAQGAGVAKCVARVTEPLWRSERDRR